ncbi:hypothetical protein C1X59_16270 [Pseudomonas sp. FW215-R2]|nr:hypothetical protein C1X59_16270 [Pseudomonas sp. FW215-R2]PMX09087.1 hypothetical protein C1X60_14830 [Pseudomonas sp. FW215-L1]PMX21490.1 hypothetical protein C1X57_17435 [Pseudomonas sp. FW215-E1]PNA23118.1 hypothetical protein C1X58_25920 [Pseudomonas sp. FW215-R4]
MKTPRLVRGVFFRLEKSVFQQRQDETSVMQLTALRPNVAYLAGSSTVADFARIHCTNRAFT